VELDIMDGPIACGTICPTKLTSIGSNNDFDTMLGSGL